jgi:NADH-quinone oxidoreductase subunit M
LNHHLITLLLFIPVLGAVLQAFVPIESSRGGVSMSRWVALGCSLASSIIGIVLITMMNPGSAEMQLSESVAWIGSYAISYDVGLDGLNSLVLLLISVLFPLLIASEWRRKEGVRGMHGLLLILQSALAGAVCSQDLFVLLFFWALSALPFYFLTGIWGGKGREEAAFRSIVTAAIGNALIFAALILVYYSLDPHTFSIHELAGGKLSDKTFLFLGQTLPVAPVSFVLISLGLALRMPVWPFHGWFTRSAEESPASVFVALSAVTVPVGAYIFVRLGYSLFPQTFAQASGVIVAIGAVNLVMGGLCAASQRGLRLLLAYLCVGEMGLVLMGAGSLSAAGVVGAIYHVLALGLSLGGFGLLAGIMLERTGELRFLDDHGVPQMGGIASQAPTTALVGGVIVASLLGFPGLSGFVGRALLVVGGFSVYPVAMVIAGAVLLLATYYLFTMYRFVFLGKTGELTSSFADLTIREKAYLLPLVAALLAFGVYPKPLIELVRPTVMALLSTMGKS